MYQYLRRGALADPVRRPHVIPIGENDLAHASARQLIQNFIARLNRVDTDIAGGVGYQQTIEVVAVGFREP